MRAYTEIPLKRHKAFDWLYNVSYQLHSSANFDALQLRGPFFIVSLRTFAVNLSPVLTKSL